LWTPQKTGLEVHVRPTRPHRLRVKTLKITWKRSKGQCGLRNKLGLILNLRERKENRVIKDDEFGGILFCLFCYDGRQRGGLARWPEAA
jgi:hypothetical protein